MTAALVCGCVTPLDPDDSLAAVPYTLDHGGRIVIDVMLDGQGPFAFALDSAASISVIFEPLPGELPLLEVEGREVVVHGAFSSGRFPLYLARRVGIGAVQWHNPRFAAMPPAERGTAEFQGILGNDFLMRYAVGFSVRDGLLRLYDPETVARRKHENFASIALRRDDAGNARAALFFMDVRVDGQPLEALFDLGAGINVVNWRAARRLGFDSAAAAAGRTTGFAGVLGEGDDVYRFTADTLEAGAVHWTRQPFAISNLPIFAVTGRAQGPTAIIGSVTLTKSDFIVDYGRSRLLVKLP